MELPYSQQGIVLASDDFKEKDRILTIYTKEFGKIRAISRGSRKIDSKLAPHLEVLSYSNLMLFSGKSLITITGAFEIKNFRNLKNSAEKLSAALYLAELLNRATFENLPDEEIFNLLLDLLKYLDKDIHESAEKLKPAEVILIFKFKLLNFLGLLPEAEKGEYDLVFKFARADFAESENLNLSTAEKEKLDKGLNYSFADILSKNLNKFNQ
ncbi:DNA repair protein RecO [Patescibacteria group bacterium]|nr:DNA repair protein RecO [Patescibacteria group bacterium]MBU4000169.1 DNA repair protein RecO [Patescibacteria group bacterium]MBU4056510.1 DNA repair protein RecO [Patescibacteria group bacterium]